METPRWDSEHEKNYLFRDLIVLSQGCHRGSSNSKAEEETNDSEAKWLRFNFSVADWSPTSCGSF